MSKKLRFLDQNKSEFFSTVKSRVDLYFKTNNISKSGNRLMYSKTAFYLGGLFLFYFLIISNQFNTYANISFGILLGVFSAFIGFNICHDAIHGSYSNNPKVNKIFSYVFNLIGANPYVWNIMHNVVHHTYTNMPGLDEDIEVAPGLIRLSADDKIYKIQRYQHIYAFALYGLASLAWVFRKDFVKFYQKQIGMYDNSKHPKSEEFKLYFFKACYYTVFMIIPYLVLDYSWWQFLIGFLVMHVAEGLVLGLVFQLAHVVEGTEFPVTNDDGNVEEAWAIHQMKTTANFARNSPIAAWLCGGLNTQVEHHLFPKICHIHYPKISEIVKQTAIEFGVPYIENTTFRKALKSHYKILKKFATEAKSYSINTSSRHSRAI